MNERELVDKLLRIQALRDGATTPGEHEAAARAWERMNARLKAERSDRPEPQDRPVEYKFTMSNMHSKRLFLALARKHGLDPFRYKRQRYTTVMIRVSKRFVDEVLWPQFQALSDTLDAYLADVTARVIAEAVHGDTSDARETPELEG